MGVRRRVGLGLRKAVTCRRSRYRPVARSYKGLLGFVWVVGGQDTAPDLGKQAPEGGASLAPEAERATSGRVAVLPPPLLGCRIGKPRWRGQARSPGRGPEGPGQGRRAA